MAEFKPKTKPTGKRVSQDMMAMGFIWFMDRLISGKPIRQMSEEYNRSPETIVKYIKKASDLLADRGKEQIMTELFPLAIKVAKAKLEYELKQYQEGKQPNVDYADRLFKGMFILDHASQEKEVEVNKQIEAGEAESLDQLMVIRRRRTKAQLEESKNKTIEATKAEIVDVGKVVDGEIQKQSE